MKNLLLIFIALILFFSCDKNQKEFNEMNSFLKANYEFNNRTLNKNRGDYYRIIEEAPSRKIEELNKLDSDFEILIEKIDHAISNNEDDIESIIIESNRILSEVPKIVKGRKDYLLPYFEQPKSISNKLSLKYIKSRLVIAMAYAFEYAGRQTYSVDGLYRVEIDSVVPIKTEKGIKLTLTSKYGQNIKENRHIIINNIELDGKEKEIDFKLKDNYSFADIEFDSLQSGIYKINGTLRFYHREQKFDIPINKTFKVE